MSLEQIANGLPKAYDYLVVPKLMLDTEVKLPKMLKEDGVTYYTINELSEALGKLFIPTDSIDTRFVKFRWSIPRNGEEALIATYLSSEGLVNMRDNGIADELNYKVEEIDFTALNGNEFGIFSNEEIREVPVVVVDEALGIDE